MAAWWEQFERPQLVAHGPAVDHNVATMARWCAEHRVALAPHAKTTMSAPLITAQLDAGAWGMTVATGRQARAVLELGVRRVLVANLLVEPTMITALARTARERGVEVWAYADGERSVSLLEQGLEAADAVWPVLLEVGVAGGRTGVRNRAQGLDVAALVDTAGHLELAGTACFEGVLPAGPDGAGTPEIAALLDEQHALTDDLLSAGMFGDRVPVVSAGGSAFFDLVVQRLGPDTFDRPVTTLLRSGCYVTHDHGLYARTSPFGDRPGDHGHRPRLEPALELLASVWSVPEPGLVIAGFGRRDVPFDSGLPVVLHHHPIPEPVEGPLRQAQGTLKWIVERMWDQHAALSVPADAVVEAGDLLRLGISHPCGAFDRWRSIPVLDADGGVRETLHPLL